MLDFIKKFLWFFIVINSGILLVFGISTLGYETIDSFNIWRIFIISAATGLVTAGFFSIDPRKPMKRVVNILLTAGHFLVLCAIVYFCGAGFGWFATSLDGLLSVLISVAVVYGFTTVIHIILVKKETDDLNEALKKFGEEKGNDKEHRI